MIEKALLDIMACPQCKGRVAPVNDGAALGCAFCGLKYPVRDGIPVLLVDDAAKVRGDS